MWCVQRLSTKCWFAKITAIKQNAQEQKFCMNVNFLKSNAFCFLSIHCIVKALWKWFHFVQFLYSLHVSSLFILSQMFVQAGSNSKQTISSLELFSSGFLCNGETKSPLRPPRLVDTNKTGTELVSKGKLYQQHHIHEDINDRTWIHTSKECFGHFCHLCDQLIEKE